MDHSPRTEITSAIRTAPDGARSDFYREYIQSTAWRMRRNQAVRDAGYRCQRCNGKRDLQVHHRSYENLGRETSADLEVLCASCHGDHHADEGKPQTVGIYLRLITSVLSTETIESVADLADALKLRCVRERIPYDADRIDRAIQIAAAGGKRVGFQARATKLPTIADLYRSPVSAEEAREFLRLLRGQLRVSRLEFGPKAMPDAALVTDGIQKGNQALEFVAREIQASMARCAELEGETQA